MENTIRRTIRTAPNKWLQEQHDEYNLHTKIKEAAGVYKKHTFFNIQNEQREMTQDNS